MILNPSVKNEIKIVAQAIIRFPPLPISRFQSAKLTFSEEPTPFQTNGTRCTQKP